MRLAAAWLRTLVVAGLFGIATAGGACSGGAASADEGLLRVVLEVEDGYVVRALHYSVDSSSGSVIKRGGVQLPADAHGMSFQLQLPAGERDTILVTATSTSGVALSGRSKPFDIAPRCTTVVTVTLPGASAADAGIPPGKIDVTGTIVAAARVPVIGSLVVSPFEVTAGSPISVSVTASDPEGGNGPSYLWTAVPDGRFLVASSPSTTYISPTTGVKTLTVMVSDQQVPALSASASVVVTILDPLD